MSGIVQRLRILFALPMAVLEKGSNDFELGIIERLGPSPEERATEFGVRVGIKL
jgi:hypothetical protein